MQIASMPLGLVSTQALLIFYGARSVKLPFFQKVAAVTVIAGTTGEVGGICLDLPALYFCFKVLVVCKKRGVYLGTYGTISQWARG